MNTERFHPLPINDLSQERLDDSLFRFADVLSGRKWDEQRVMAVSMARSATDYIGDEYALRTVDIHPITMQTKVSFKADKTGGLAGDVEFGTPRYGISSVVEQDIEFDELPQNVKNETLEEVAEKCHPLREVLKDFVNFSDSSDVYETLSLLPMMRRAKSKFVIADGGEIIRHEVAHRYAYEDVVFLSADYSSDTGSMDWRRLERGDSLAVELRPAILEYISEDPQTREREIMRQAEGLDNEFERHFFEGSVKEMLRADRQPTESVVRQILGMLAIVSADVRGYRP